MARAMPTVNGLRRRLLATATVAALGALAVSPRGATPRFYGDDPLRRAPETQDASHVKARDIPLVQDLLLNLFAHPGDHADPRAGDVNTADEVPDSSWFTNRIHARQVPVDEVARGPNAGEGPAPGRWTVVSAKVSGVSPGFTVRDGRGARWFLQFDADGYPVAATSAIAVACRLFWTLGYNQIESYLVEVRPELLDVDASATVAPRPGLSRPLRPSDIETVLRRANRGAGGAYRAIAGRAVAGRPVGPFAYSGTRPDDPNDLVPHEHRRVLRALKVFGAWTNLVDMKAGNTLDAVVDTPEGPRVRHYLQDVGSTFGTSALGPRDWDEGSEYLFEGVPLLKRLVSVGFYLRPWQTVPYDEEPEVGRFEGRQFDPQAWRPRVPTPAFLHARDDDTFWAALRVTAFTDEQIRAAVHAGQYSDPEAERLLGDVLIERRDRIGRAYLPTITPLAGFVLDDRGLTFENVAQTRAGLPPPDGGYRAEWSAFDNATGEARPLATSEVRPSPAPAPPGALPAPEAMPQRLDAYVRVAVTAPDSRHPAWSRPVIVYFRREAAGWRLVGVERPGVESAAPTS